MPRYNPAPPYRRSKIKATLLSLTLLMLSSSFQMTQAVSVTINRHARLDHHNHKVLNQTESQNLYIHSHSANTKNSTSLAAKGTTNHHEGSSHTKKTIELDKEVQNKTVDLRKFQAWKLSEEKNNETTIAEKQYNGRLLNKISATQNMVEEDSKSDLTVRNQTSYLSIDDFFHNASHRWQRFALLVGSFIIVLAICFSSSLCTKLSRDAQLRYNVKQYKSKYHRQMVMYALMREQQKRNNFSDYKTNFFQEYQDEAQYSAKTPADQFLIYSNRMKQGMGRIDYHREIINSQRLQDKFEQQSQNNFSHSPKYEESESDSTVNQQVQKRGKRLQGPTNAITSPTNSRGNAQHMNSQQSNVKANLQSADQQQAGTEHIESCSESEYSIDSDSIRQEQAQMHTLSVSQLNSASEVYRMKKQKTPRGQPQVVFDKDCPSSRSIKESIKLKYQKLTLGIIEGIDEENCDVVSISDKSQLGNKTERVAGSKSRDLIKSPTHSSEDNDKTSLPSPTMLMRKSMATEINLDEGRGDLTPIQSEQEPTSSRQAYNSDQNTDQIQSGDEESKGF